MDKRVNPAYQQIWIRDSAFWGGLAMALLSAIVLEIMRGVWNVPWSNTTLGLMLGFIVTGIILCTATIRKVNFYTFTNLSGTPLFSIARSGKEKEAFKSFVSHIVGAANIAQSFSEHQGAVDAAARRD